MPGPVPAAAQGAGPQAELEPMSSPRVLVVDDTSSMRTEIRHLLEDAGLTVVGEGGDGAEGVMLARELLPDVVVMDVRMPILDGIAATGYITRELPNTRVIVFSAFDDHELTNAARAAGASGFPRAPRRRRSPTPSATPPAEAAARPTSGFVWDLAAVTG